MMPLKILKTGKMIIVIDDADRENEGDLIIAAEKNYSSRCEFYYQKRARYAVRFNHRRKGGGTESGTDG